MIRVIEGVGMMMWMLGSCSMDSENMLIPAAVTAIGLAMTLIACRHDDTLEME